MPGIVEDRDYIYVGGSVDNIPSPEYAACIWNKTNSTLFQTATRNFAPWYVGDGHALLQGTAPARTMFLMGEGQLRATSLSGNINGGFQQSFPLTGPHAGRHVALYHHQTGRGVLDIETLTTTTYPPVEPFGLFPLTRSFLYAPTSTPGNLEIWSASERLATITAPATHPIFAGALQDQDGLVLSFLGGTPELNGIFFRITPAGIVTPLSSDAVFLGLAAGDLKLSPGPTPTTLTTYATRSGIGGYVQQDSRIRSPNYHEDLPNDSIKTNGKQAIAAKGFWTGFEWIPHPSTATGYYWMDPTRYVFRGQASHQDQVVNLEGERQPFVHTNPFRSLCPATTWSNATEFSPTKFWGTHALVCRQGSSSIWDFGAIREGPGLGKALAGVYVDYASDSAYAPADNNGLLGLYRIEHNGTLTRVGPWPTLQLDARASIPTLYGPCFEIGPKGVDIGLRDSTIRIRDGTLTIIPRMPNELTIHSCTDDVQGQFLVGIDNAVYERKHSQEAWTTRGHLPRPTSVVQNIIADVAPTWTLRSPNPMEAFLKDSIVPLDASILHPNLALRSLNASINGIQACSSSTTTLRCEVQADTLPRVNEVVYKATYTNGLTSQRKVAFKVIQVPFVAVEYRNNRAYTFDGSIWEAADFSSGFQDIRFLDEPTYEVMTSSTANLAGARTSNVNHETATFVNQGLEGQYAYLSNQGEVKTRNQDGAIRTYATGIQAPTGLAWVDGDHIYVRSDITRPSTPEEVLLDQQPTRRAQAIQRCHVTTCVPFLDSRPTLALEVDYNHNAYVQLASGLHALVAANDTIAAAPTLDSTLGPYFIVDPQHHIQARNAACTLTIRDGAATKTISLPWCGIQTYVVRTTPQLDYVYARYATGASVYDVANQSWMSLQTADASYNQNAATSKDADFYRIGKKPSPPVPLALQTTQAIPSNETPQANNVTEQAQTCAQQAQNQTSCVGYLDLIAPAVCTIEDRDHDGIPVVKPCLHNYRCYATTVGTLVENVTTGCQRRADTALGAVGDLDDNDPWQNLLRTSQPNVTLVQRPTSAPPATNSTNSSITSFDAGKWFEENKQNWPWWLLIAAIVAGGYTTGRVRR
ncbi:MAG: hypothetical protein AABX89_07380 [Candidatus Thermoplasmatota archaeon]